MTNVDSKTNRDTWVKEDPLLKRLIIDRSRMLFEGGIALVDTNDDPIDQNEDILDRIEELKWSENFALASMYEMTHGFCPILIMNEGDTFRGGLTGAINGWTWDHPENSTWTPDSIDRLVPLSLLEIHEVDVNELAEPTNIHLHYEQSGMDEPIDIAIHPSRCIWANTRPVDRSYQGLELVRPIWDHIIWFAWTCDSMGWYDAKHGMGLLTLFTGGPVPADKEADLDAILRDVNKRRGMWIPLSKDSAGIEHTGPSSSPDFNSHLEWHLNAICSATGAPKNWLRGDQQGSVTGSETDLKELFSHLRILQDRWRPYLRLLIGYLFPDIDAASYRIKFNLKFVLDEKTEQETLNLKATTASMLQQFSSMEEVRTFWGYEEASLPMEEIAGVDKLMLTMPEEGGADSEDKSKGSSAKSSPPKREGLRDTAPRLYQLCDLYGVDGWAQLRAVLLDKYGSMSNSVKNGEPGSKATWYCWDRRYPPVR